MSEWGWANPFEVYVTTRGDITTITYPKPEGIKNHSDILEERMRNEFKEVKAWRFNWY